MRQEKEQDKEYGNIDRQQVSLHPEEKNTKNTVASVWRLSIFPTLPINQPFLRSGGGE